MTISILMPFKNEALHLHETMASILSQSHSNFELLAIDDHSQDDSYQILQKYAQKDQRIKLLKNHSLGIIEALRCAFASSSGSFITRHDADDIMPIQKLENLKSLLIRYGRNHLATGKVKYFSDTEVGGGFKNYEKWLNSLISNDNHYNFLFRECIVPSPNWMMYRQDVIKLKIFSSAFYPEDYFLAFKLFEYNFRIKGLETISHYWRDHTHRASRTLPQYQDQSFYEMKIKFFEQFYGLKNIVIWGAGPTGKKFAKFLIKKNISFCWVTNNEKKIGKIIYQQKILNYRELSKIPQIKVLILVNQRNQIDKITETLKSMKIQNFFIF